MRFLMWIGYHLRRNSPRLHERLFGEQWNGNRRWWRMISGIVDSIAVIVYDLIGV